MSVFLSRISFLFIQTNSKRCYSSSKLANELFKKYQLFPTRNDKFSASCKVKTLNYTTDTIHPVAPLESGSVLLKKKTIHKKVVLSDITIKDGHFLTLAYATANSYDLKSMKEALLQQKLYEPAKLKAQEALDVMVATAVYSVGSEPREIIFFKEGAVVFWNCSEMEASNVLDFVRKYEIESYPREVVEKEREIMTYAYQDNVRKCHLQDETFILVPNRDNSLERYTFSHAMAQSARLGAWESRLEGLAAAVRQHSSVMERDGITRVEKKEVVRKLGELFSLRHILNVESDLLDTPDFYWEEEQLEKLYSSTVAYFTIPRRTRVLNERLAHCVELLELVSSWASDRHHVRLEWMVIALILAEVCFEVLHLVERHWQVDAGHKSGSRDRRGAARLVFSNEFEENMFNDLAILDT